MEIITLRPMFRSYHLREVCGPRFGDIRIGDHPDALPRMQSHNVPLKLKFDWRDFIARFRLQ